MKMNSIHERSVFNSSILGSAGDGDLRDTILNIFKKVNPSSIKYCDPLSSGNVEPKKPPLIHQNENV